MTMSPATVLIIDDEPNLVELISIVLKQAGYRVLTAANGLDGLRRLAERPVDMVIVDLSMPIMNGRQFIEHLRASATTSDVPVLVLTGSALTADIMPTAGSYERILGKPFDIIELAALVGDMVGPVTSDCSAGNAD